MWYVQYRPQYADRQITDLLNEPFLRLLSEFSVWFWNKLIIISAKYTGWLAANSSCQCIVFYNVFVGTQIVVTIYTKYSVWKQMKIKFVNTPFIQCVWHTHACLLAAATYKHNPTPRPCTIFFLFPFSFFFFFSSFRWFACTALHSYIRVCVCESRERCHIHIVQLLNSKMSYSMFENDSQCRYIFSFTWFFFFFSFQ